MLYSKNQFPKYVKTAGKITVATALTGLFVFMIAFMFDVGSRELSHVSAQTASTTLTVLNTPPEFTLNAYESPDSSTSTPTNSGDNVQWAAIAVDSNGAPYFLLICETNASPTAASSTLVNGLGTAAPSCATGVKQWGVSAAASSGEMAIVATTTTEGGQFSTTTTNNWYAWVCDDDPVSPRCNNITVQGPTSTTASSSPFHVNSRPVLTNFYNDGGYVPGTDLNVNFFSTSSDPDLVGGEDTLKIVVCQAIGWATSTDTCYDSNDFLASTTIAVTQNATTSFVIPLPIRDDSYPAYAYLVDEHGHEALNNPFNQDYDILNAAPYVLSADINFNGSDDLIPTVPGGETTGFTLDVKVKDYNSCLTSASTTEIKGFYASVFRNGSSTDCSGVAGDHDPNNCYTSSASEAAWTVPTTTWNLSCTATTTCQSPLQDNIEYSCTFPLWFVAEPTGILGNATPPDLPSFLATDYWTAGIEPYDIDYATGTRATTSSAKELYPLTALDVLAGDIAYGSLEPGDNSGSLNATSTIISLGNTGLDQETSGHSMCGTFTTSTHCPVSASSTIPDWRQQFSSTTELYDTDALFGGAGLDPLVLQLSSSTDQELELNVQKATSTLLGEVTRGTSYWGILVPGSITLAGNYTGLNTFTAVAAEPEDWF